MEETCNLKAKQLCECSASHTGWPMQLILSLFDTIGVSVLFIYVFCHFLVWRSLTIWCNPEIPFRQLYIYTSRLVSNMFIVTLMSSLNTMRIMFSLFTMNYCFFNLFLSFMQIFDWNLIIILHKPLVVDGFTGSWLFLAVLDWWILPRIFKYTLWGR